MTDKLQTLAEQIGDYLNTEKHDGKHRVIDIAYNAFMYGASKRNSEDGGPCDWFNDTRPFVVGRIDAIRAALADAAATTTPAEHFDDHAVRQFAKMMAAKMAVSRAKGRSGWDDPNQCSVEHLQALLHEHVAKGDPVDVANICMMLRHYDASTTTTTPIVVAEQAGDVRQAVRVKPLEAWKVNDCLFGGYPDLGEDFVEVMRRGENAKCWQFAEAHHIDWEITSGPEDVLIYRRVERITAALEPDPTPALGWKAMQTAAAEAVAKEAHGETVLGGQRFKTVKLEDAVEAILALPGPTADQLLADAVRLPEVQAVVKCLDREKSLIWIIENTVQVLIRDLALEMLGQQRAALKAWRDGQRPPTEYEQKLAALKKDFPNGI